MNASAKKHNPLYRVFREDLFNQGMAVINTPPTKHYINQPDTTIDHLMMSSPDKILNHQILKSYNSDHYPVMFTWSQKGQLSGIIYIIPRKFKNINWNEIRGKHSQDVRLATATCSTDPNTIFSLLSSAIEDSLFEQAPSTKIQIKQKLPKFFTQDTIDIIKKHDEAYKEAKLSGDIDNIRLLKKLRNCVRKFMKRDKENSIKTKMNEVKNDPKKEWQQAKHILGWKPARSPAVLSVNGKTVTKTRNCRCNKLCNHHQNVQDTKKY